MKKTKLSDISFKDTMASEPVGPPLVSLLSGSQERNIWIAYWLVDPVLGGLNFLTHHLLRLLSVSGCSKFGATLAPFARGRFSKTIFARRISDNIKVLRPDAADDGDLHEALLSNWWQNVGRVYAEFSVADRHWTDGHIEVTGAEHVHALREQGRKVIFVSAHLGHWEAQASVLSHAFDVDMTGPYQPEPSRFTNRLIYQLRKRRGQLFFPPGRKSAQILRKVMADPDVCGIFYLDDVRDAQIHFPLFGRAAPKAGNAVSAIKLALSLDAEIIPVFMIRKKDADYELKVLPVVEFDREAGRVAAIEAAIHSLDRMIEPVILSHIDQWYMLAELRNRSGKLLPSSQPQSDK